MSREGRAEKKKTTTLKLKVFAILLTLAIIALSFFIFNYKGETKVIENSQNQTNETLNITNVTRPFQENISIEVPPGVVRIEKGGRIRTVS
jgi:flagellar basal body-associated protein FliL